jgi:hypothetical protein
MPLVEGSQHARNCPLYSPLNARKPLLRIRVTAFCLSVLTHVHHAPAMLRHDDERGERAIVQIVRCEPHFKQPCSCGCRKGACALYYFTEHRNRVCRLARRLERGQSVVERVNRLKVDFAANGAEMDLNIAADQIGQRAAPMNELSFSIDREIAAGKDRRIVT